MKREVVKCPYCKGQAVLRDGTYVHGQSAAPGEKVWVCSHYPQCDSYVTAYQGVNRPAGILANAALRQKRQEAHRALRRLWTEGIMTKREAYQWLRFQLGLAEPQAHIDRFMEYRCDTVIQMCQAAVANRRKAS